MKKAQLFTLDLMLSFALVVLAIGLTIHSFELNTYSLREEELYNELKNKAETASLMLSINEKLNCSVQNTNIRMQNCIYPNVQQLKNELGLSSEFGCKITYIDGVEKTLGNCTESVPQNINNVISIKKSLLLLSDTIDKSKWNDCVNGNCANYIKEFTITIWRE